MSTINPHIFRAYDIRGIAMTKQGQPLDLTPETAYLIGKGTGTYLQAKYGTRKMVVGADCRLTGKTLKDNYIKGLIETNIQVTDLGLAVSPMIYWAVCAYRYDSGTNVTASHNPKEYNGFKIVSENAHSVCGGELREILKIIESGKFTEDKRPSKIETKNLLPFYIGDLAKRIKIGRKLKVVVDCGNGAAGLFAPEFLRKIGCEVIELFCNPDGNFPNHEANPEELKNMRALIKAVLDNRADLGIGFDGDGDRIGVVDEKGKMYSSDYMLLLLTKDLVNRIKTPKIVFDIKTSQAVIDEIKSLGAEPVMCKTGHSFIENKMKEIGSPLAGEVSGHLFFGENYYGFDDALLAAGKIIEILSNETHPLSQMFNNLPQVFTTPEFKAPCPDEKKFEIVKSLVDHFTKIYPCITIDGVRINFDKSSWGAVRASNTSPNLTMRFEAQTKTTLKEIQGIMAHELSKYPDVSMNWYKR